MKDIYYHPYFIDYDEALRKIVSSFFSSLSRGNLPNDLKFSNLT